MQDFELNFLLRPHLVCGIGIPLGKWIVIIGNEDQWNGIIIPIPQFGDNTYFTIRIVSKLLRNSHNFLFFKKTQILKKKKKKYLNLFEMIDVE
jgi:hypothetical protein